MIETRSCGWIGCEEDAWCAINHKQTQKLSTNSRNDVGFHRPKTMRYPKPQYIADKERSSMERMKIGEKGKETQTNDAGQGNFVLLQHDRTHFCAWIGCEGISNNYKMQANTNHTTELVINKVEKKGVDFTRHLVPCSACYVMRARRRVSSVRIRLTCTLTSSSVSSWSWLWGVRPRASSRDCLHVAMSTISISAVPPAFSLPAHTSLSLPISLSIPVPALVAAPRPLPLPVSVPLELSAPPSLVIPLVSASRHGGPILRTKINHMKPSPHRKTEFQKNLALKRVDTVAGKRNKEKIVTNGPVKIAPRISLPLFRMRCGAESIDQGRID